MNEPVYNSSGPNDSSGWSGSDKGKDSDVATDIIGVIIDIAEVILDVFSYIV